MIITIDGLDGSGKSTLARKLANRLHFKYIDKPIYQLFNVTGDDNILYEPIYLLQNAVYNETQSDRLKAWFTGMSLLYIKEVMASQNIIIDRGLLSGYAFNGNADSDIVFETLLNLGIWFDLSIFLYVSTDIRIQRLKKRNPNDPDLKFKKILNLNYNSVDSFIKKHPTLPILVIDTDALTESEVFDKAIDYMKSLDMI